jgi:hypothetical protein
MRKRSDVGLEPIYNIARGRSPKLTLVTAGLLSFRIKGRLLNGIRRWEADGLQSQYGFGDDILLNLV